jgi:hypothetical protein
MRYETQVEAERLDDRPLADLIRELMQEGQTLLREEARLAKAEIRAEAKKAAKGGAAIGAGGALLHTALLLLAATLVLLGATFLPEWVSALIVTILFAAGGWAAVSWGKKRLSGAEPARAVENIKEDGRWAKETMRSIKSERHAHA